MKFSTTNFPKIFFAELFRKNTIIFPEISGKIPQENSELTTLASSIPRSADFHDAPRNSLFAAEKRRIPILLHLCLIQVFGLLFNFAIYKTIKSCCKLNFDNYECYDMNGTMRVNDIDIIYDDIFIINGLM